MQVKHLHKKSRRPPREGVDRNVGHAIPLLSSPCRPPREGVDRNASKLFVKTDRLGRPPREGVDRNISGGGTYNAPERVALHVRAWIEIPAALRMCPSLSCRPPREGVDRNP